MATIIKTKKLLVLGFSLLVAAQLLATLLGTIYEGDKIWRAVARLAIFLLLGIFAYYKSSKVALSFAVLLSLLWASEFAYWTFQGLYDNALVGLPLAGGGLVLAVYGFNSRKRNHAA